MERICQTFAVEEIGKVKSGKGFSIEWVVLLVGDPTKVYSSEGAISLSR